MTFVCWPGLGACYSFFCDRVSVGLIGPGGPPGVRLTNGLCGCVSLPLTCMVFICGGLRSPPRGEGGSGEATGLGKFKITFEEQLQILVA